MNIKLLILLFLVMGLLFTAACSQEKYSGGSGQEEQPETEISEVFEEPEEEVTPPAAPPV